MTTEDERAQWGTPGWRADVLTWLAGVQEVGDAAELGLEEVQTSLWSTVWRVSSGSGRRWFKQSLTAQRHEGSVQTALAGLAGAWVDRPVAIEPDRGWLLTEDGGPTLWAAAGGDARAVPIADVGRLLADYAALQQVTIGHRDVLTRAGLPVRLPRDAAREAADLARRLADHPDDDPRHLSPAEVDRVLAAGPALTAAAEVLDDGPVPLCLDHGDLFVGNVLRPRVAGAGFRFLDLAEAVWAHPFGSPIMLVWELVHRWQIEVPDDRVDVRDPRLQAVLDAYLTCWGDHGSLDRLRPLAEAALRLGALHRARACLDKLEHAQPGRPGTGPEWMWRQPRSWLLDLTRPVRVWGSPGPDYP